MSADFAAMLGGSDNTVKDLGQLWGSRSGARRTMGSPARTKAMAALRRLEDLGFEGIAELREDLQDGWAAEMGWETRQLIRALSATRGQLVEFRERNHRREPEDA